jgi:hypothetical protein
MNRHDQPRLGAGRDDAGPVDDAQAAAAEPGEEVSEIRESIEQTRADMSQTIDELQQRLEPAHLKEQMREQVIEHYRQVKESVRDATIGKVEDMVERVSDSVYATRRSIVDTVTANPVPAALVGIGLAWLWMNRRETHGGRGRYERADMSSSRYDEFGRRIADSEPARFEQYGETMRDVGGRARDLASKAGTAVGDLAGQVQNAAGDLAGKAKAKVTGVVGQAQRSAGQLANQAQHQARRAEERVTSALHENPLAVGAVALALGTAVGLALPQTRKENEWLGEARDALVDKAQTAAQDAIDEVKEVAQRVTDEMAPARGESSQPGGVL